MRRAVQEADNLVQEYGTRDPFELCNQLGIYVVDCVLPPQISGFYQRQSEGSFLYLNEQLEGRRRRVVCAHELGHAVLHEKYNFLFMARNGYHVMSRFEKEADLFGAELLIEPEEIREGMDLQTIARYWGFSEEILRLKFGKF